MFKNLTVYRIGPDWSATLADVEAALDGDRFAECGATQDKSVGWVEPRGEAHGPLVEAVDGQWILKLLIETKAVPGHVVRRKAQEQIDHIEATTGRKPGKKESKEIREDARLALLPNAFPRQSAVWVWIDPQERLLFTDAGSQARSDEVVTALVRGLDGLQLALLQTRVSPQAAMATWLAAQDADALPAAFNVERECELKSGDEMKSVVKFTRHNLDTDEVRQHIAEGKLPTRLALGWEGRVAFTLTEGLQLRKIQFLDGVFEDAGGDKEDRFDANVAISTGELGKLVGDLVEALGGEQEAGTATTPAPAPAARAPAGPDALVTPTPADDPPF